MAETDLADEGRSFVRLGPYLRRVGPAFVRQVRLSHHTTSF